MTGDAHRLSTFMKEDPAGLEWDVVGEGVGGTTGGVEEVVV